MSEVFSIGGVGSVILVSTILTIAVSLAIVLAYQRQIAAVMRREADTGASEAPPPAQRVPVEGSSTLGWREIKPGADKPSQGENARLRERAMHGPTRALAVYAAAGLAYALMNALFWLTSAGISVLPLRLVIVTLTFAWPLVLTANVLTQASPATQARNVAAYAVALVVLMGFDLSGAAQLWFLTAGPPTVVLAALMFPKVRAVGPLVFAFMTIGVQGANMFLEPFASRPGQQVAGRVAASTGMSAITWVLLSALIGFAIAGVAGWLAVGWVRDRYDAKLVSDQSLSVDAMWLVFTVYNSLDIANEGGGWALLALGTFVVYRLLVSAGFQWSRDAFAIPRAHRLLLLRVFGPTGRARQLMSHIGGPWRYIGSMQLISGTDLAASTLEPHQLLEFVRGRLENRYIKDLTRLERRLAEVDVRPDFDARFRITEFLCYEDTWRATLERLASTTDAVLMDLRGFSRVHGGCVFELGALVNVVPIDRVVLVVDATTDLATLHAVVDQVWAQLAPTSPNRSAESGELKVCWLPDDTDPAGVQSVIGSLVDASTFATPSAPMRGLGVEHLPSQAA